MLAGPHTDVHDSGLRQNLVLWAFLRTAHDVDSCPLGAAEHSGAHASGPVAALTVAASRWRAPC